MSQIVSVDPGLRERKRLATHQRIADEAARLAAQKGVERTTIDDIAAAADIGRATFFRYFDAKEAAVVEGVSVPWLLQVVEALDTLPPELSALDAVVAAFSALAPGLEEGGLERVLAQARLATSSPGLQAWTLHAYLRVEHAIAASVASRFPDLRTDDPRPRLLGAMTMAAVRISLDSWLASDGRTDLAALLHEGVRALEVR